MSQFSQAHGTSCNFSLYLLSLSLLFSAKLYNVTRDRMNRIFPTIMLVDRSHILRMCVCMCIYVHIYIHIHIYPIKPFCQSDADDSAGRAGGRREAEQGDGLLPRYLEFDYPIRPMAFPPSSGHDWSRCNNIISISGHSILLIINRELIFRIWPCAFRSLPRLYPPAPSPPSSPAALFATLLRQSYSRLV